jgi:hypothetical protein
MSDNTKVRNPFFSISHTIVDEGFRVLHGQAYGLSPCGKFTLLRLSQPVLSWHTVLTFDRSLGSRCVYSPSEATLPLGPHDKQHYDG